MTVEETQTIQKVPIAIHFRYKMPQNVGCLNIYYFNSELNASNWVSHKSCYVSELLFVYLCLTYLLNTLSTVKLKTCSCTSKNRLTQNSAVL